MPRDTVHAAPLKPNDYKLSQQIYVEFVKSNYIRKPRKLLKRKVVVVVVVLVAAAII
jgi:hypothetical protein